jgi:ectoine hydroxylase-related dioxygenase (phytanoyl-CoA dioxygenase family)
MISYTKLPFKRQRYHFVEEIEELFWGRKAIGKYLSLLHLHSKEEYTKLFEVGKDSSTIFHQQFYDKYRTGWPSLENIYQNFIREFVSKQFDEDFLYQKWPTFRVMLPNNVAVGAFHNDAEFGHPDGEVNFVIPLTDSDDTASIWVESSPGKKDFQPMKLRIGVLNMFDGNHLTHGNKVNLTGKTRVSMDFRILPISKYHEDQAKESITRKTKFVEGEYFTRFIK